MRNSLKSDQDRHSVGPDLDPNSLERLSASDKCSASMVSVKDCFVPEWSYLVVSSDFHALY